MIDVDLQEYKEFAESVARKAGEIMLAYFHSGDFRTIIKEDQTPVTLADIEINKMVIDRVAEIFPEHAVQGEEESAVRDSKYVWVCDPVDGTIPFSKKIPIAAFSLALVCDGVPILGVVLDPFGDKLYIAEKGCGAFCNNKKLSVSTKTLDYGVINIEWWQDAIADIVIPLHKISRKTHMYHIHLPSIVYASALVAEGKLEASVFPGGKGKNVDIAALKVIIEEAGGKVTDLFGNEQRYDRSINGAIISNGIVHDDIVETLKNI